MYQHNNNSELFTYAILGFALAEATGLEKNNPV